MVETVICGIAVVDRQPQIIGALTDDFIDSKRLHST